jgi:hypothetical protein
MPAVMRAFSIVCLVLAIYAIVGTDFFNAADPENFGSFFVTSFTLFEGLARSHARSRSHSRSRARALSPSTPPPPTQLPRPGLFPPGTMQLRLYAIVGLVWLV